LCHVPHQAAATGCYLPLTLGLVPLKYSFELPRSVGGPAGILHPKNLRSRNSHAPRASAMANFRPPRAPGEGVLLYPTCLAVRDRHLGTSSVVIRIPKHLKPLWRLEALAGLQGLIYLRCKFPPFGVCCLWLQVGPVMAPSFGASGQVEYLPLLLASRLRASRPLVLPPLILPCSSAMPARSKWDLEKEGGIRARVVALAAALGRAGCSSNWLRD
jgi:hypothetical protein